MTGLVNAIGSGEGSRVQAALKQGQRSKPAESHRLLPPLLGVHAAAKVLRKAVETVRFATGGAQRRLPGGDESDRNDQADHEASPPDASRGRLDVVA